MAESMTWRRGGIGHWRRHVIPIAVWMGAIAVAGTLLARRAVTCEHVGVAIPEERTVAALTDGRIRLLAAEPFVHVKAGQTLAVLEDEQVRAALATAAAEAARLRLKVAAEQSRLAAEATEWELGCGAHARRYAVDLESNRLRACELRVTLEADGVQLEFLRLQRELMQKLCAEGAVAELRFKAADAECRALEERVAATASVLKQVQQDVEAARARQQDFAGRQGLPPNVETALEPLRAAITVQERRIDELAVAGALLVLKAPLDGRVSELLRGVGETVRVGETIATIVAERPVAVVVYATPAEVTQLEPGAGVQLELARGQWERRVVQSHVLAVGPTVEQLPQRLWRNLSVPEWGWPVRIAVPPTLDALCGETMGVAIESATNE